MQNSQPTISSNILPFQPELRPVLPTIEGNVDYLEFRSQLERMNEILVMSGVEARFVAHSLKQWLGRKGRSVQSMNHAHRLRFQIHSMRALRCNLARTLLGEDFRGMSARMADSPLLQWFCGLGRMERVRVPAKSTLQRYAEWVDADGMREIIERLLQKAVEGDPRLRMKAPLDAGTCFLDTTCVKANIHFPVDWVLLRDATRTLMKACQLIREHGLRHRMEEPSEFMRRMNRLSIQMSGARRKADSKKERKRALRLMKKQVKVVASHAGRYRQLLDTQWAKTDWTRREAEVVLRRIDGVLELLPQAQKQAHERIIGERVVANADKILSLYEREIRVIVRGKAGAEVEFGNTLILGESAQGVIVDWQLIRQQAPADCMLVKESVRRVKRALGKNRLEAVGGDRGFDSSGNRWFLEQEGLFNAICPRDPRRVAERMEDERFMEMQRRRAQTEGRIGIFKNGFLGRPMRAKGFGHREIQVAWGVLTHNLWVIARLPVVKRRQVRQAA